MTIEKVINNNVVTAIDASNQEVVLMGKGIGFQAKQGDAIWDEMIEKKFVLSNAAEIGKFEEVVSSIPMEHLDVCVEIINYATEVLGTRLSSSIYISLTDHINFALESYKAGNMFENPLAQEVKRFYYSEYLVGKHAVDLIEQRLGIRLSKYEEASIAMHFVNAEYQSAMNDTMHIMTLIREIVDRVGQMLNTFIDESEINAARFISHLKFLAFRVLHNEQIVIQDEEYNEMVKKLYPEAFLKVNDIASFVKEKYNYTMTISEMVNMTVHVQRIHLNIVKEKEHV